MNMEIRKTGSGLIPEVLFPVFLISTSACFRASALPRFRD